MKVYIFKNNIAGAVKYFFIKFKVDYYYLFISYCYTILPRQTTQNLPVPIIQRRYQVWYKFWVSFSQCINIL